MMENNDNKHSHCQAAQTKAQTQAWQRVSLPATQEKTTITPTDEKEQRRHNRVGG
ncbi:MAG: hypothetical protein PF495_14585 [Spirochaetales bacterium]|jgi:hypothetical protein|nr:hypothetical protein [Spirochaetales bacterium]